MKALYHRTISPLLELTSAWHTYFAAAMLALMFGLGVTSMAGDSAIVDELAHIPAGYSYLHYADYRLNPEHPPFIKDLAGIPLQFMNLQFPDYEPAWTTDANGQWESGWNFLYHIGNNADAILFWSRLPILLLSIAFGIVLYVYCLRRWGKAVALLTLFFYTLSPNIIAHSRFVTTDLGATVFIFIALLTFARFVERPTGRNLLILSLGLAVAQVAKFSAFLLYPFLLIVSLALVTIWKKPKSAQDRFGLYTGGLVLASVISMAWVWLFYAPHTLNMPLEVQDRLIRGGLPIPGFQQTEVAFLTTINHFPLVQPFAQYLLGIAMVFTRVTSGNVTYFNGQVSNQSYHSYFIELFLVKTQIALLILMVAGLAGVLWRYLRVNRRRAVEALPASLLHSFRSHITEWVIGSFAAFYFAISVAGNLNLGIRHILPVYVPVFVLVAIAVVHLMRDLDKTKWKYLTGFALVALLGWYGGQTVATHPAYLSYFNEFIGGADNAGGYYSDSSVDWGQDLRRFVTYVRAHPEINHIAVDYFGGGDPRYYFCNRKYDQHGRLIATSEGYDCSNSVFESWHSEQGQYTGEYIAVSETFLENDRYYSQLNGTSGYQYLRDRKPMVIIGGSIYIYHLVKP